MVQHIGLASQSPKKICLHSCNVTIGPLHRQKLHCNNFGLCKGIHISASLITRMFCHLDFHKYTTCIYVEVLHIFMGASNDVYLQIIHLKRFQFLNNRWVKSQKIVRFPMKNFDPRSYLSQRTPQHTLDHYLDRHFKIQNTNGSTNHNR